jgi:aryl-alcohol dehydrogenase-like predicted oxidoreductase
MNQAHRPNRESVEISGTPIRASRIGLGTWAMGGSMWGGTDSLESVATIRAAVGQGINLIDTAPPAYGFGVSLVHLAVRSMGLTRAAIDPILSETISDPIGPEFMAPPNRSTPT